MQIKDIGLASALLLVVRLGKGNIPHALHKSDHFGLSTGRQLLGKFKVLQVDPISSSLQFSRMKFLLNDFLVFDNDTSGQMVLLYEF